MSETAERTCALRPKFTGTLRLRPGPPPNAEPAVTPPAPPVTAAAVDETAQRVADLALCRERFPAVFDADRPLPLAIGVHEPLAGVIGPERARAVLEWWTMWPPYVAAIAAGHRRYHLDGTEAGELSKSHRRFARTSIAGRAAAGKPPGRGENAGTA